MLPAREVSNHFTLPAEGPFIAHLTVRCPQVPSERCALCSVCGEICWQLMLFFSLEAAALTLAKGGKWGRTSWLEMGESCPLS